ncbi:MAG: M20/M25/M40 family metallo-hydrolase, partial [Calditrichaeota bacterium]
MRVNRAGHCCASLYSIKEETSMDDFDLLLAQLNSYREEIIEIQRCLVAIPALAPESGGQGEDLKASYIEQLLREVGVDELTRYDAPDERVMSGKRPNLVAKIYGKQRNKTVWVITHMDVVPAGDLSKWDAQPFQLQVKDDMLVGRGTEDNHQGLVSALIAIKALREMRIEPEFTIGLLIVADEETGSEYGLEFIMRTGKDLFRQEDWFLIPDAGDPH